MKPQCHLQIVKAFLQKSIETGTCICLGSADCIQNSSFVNYNSDIQGHLSNGSNINDSYNSLVFVMSRLWLFIIYFGQPWDACLTAHKWLK